MDTNQDNKTCLNCEKIIVGRLDKKFCSSDCRNEYNNRRYRVEQRPVIKINKILKNNRKILQQLNPTGNIEISAELLIKSGFDLQYFTNISVTDSGDEYRYCYDQGYCFDEDKDAYSLTVRNIS